MDIRCRFHSGEKGQALTELVCVMPILLCAILIVLFMAGSGLSNIRALKEARSNAEHKAVKTESASGGTAIKSWNYNGIVPFSAKDSANDGNNFGPANNVAAALDGSAWSSNAGNVPYYEFTAYPLLSVSGVRKSYFAIRPEMFQEAAELVQGRADDKDEAGSFFYDRWRHNEINKFELNFSRFFSVRINDIDIAGQRANTVYFPALK